MSENNGSVANGADVLGDIAEKINAAPEAVRADSYQQVEDSVQTFDKRFANDQFAEDYHALGQEGRELSSNATDKCVRYVRFGARMYNIMVKEKNAAPDGYNRPRVIAKLEDALLLSDANVGECNPHHVLAAFWVVFLDHSTASGSPPTRSFLAADKIPADFFGGNLSYGALKVLSTCISRVKAKDTEIDVWEYKPQLEAFVRLMIRRLRNFELVISTLEALVKYEKERIAENNEIEARSKMDARTIKEREERALNRKKEDAAIKLKRKVQNIADEVAKDPLLALNQEKFGEFLMRAGVVPPPPKPSVADVDLDMDQIAAVITAGEAKQLIQSLLDLYEKGDNSRGPVLNALLEYSQGIAQGIQSGKHDKLKALRAGQKQPQVLKATG